jgi:hypothetical protein
MTDTNWTHPLLEATLQTATASVPANSAAAASPHPFPYEAPHD